MAYVVYREKGIAKAVVRHDGAVILVNALGNRDWLEFVAWNESQGLPLSLDPIEPTLEEQRQAKLALLAAWWDDCRAAGVTPTSQAYALGIDADDVALLNGAFTQASVAVQLGLRTVEDVFPIVDISGEAILLTVEQMTAALLSYGAQRAALSIEYATRKAAIEQAEDLAALDAITIGEA